MTGPQATTAPPEPAPRPRLHHCLVLANPAAGSVTGDLVARVAEGCRAAIPEVRTRWTGHAGSAGRIIADEVHRPRPPDLVVVVGGDGTVREAAEGLARALHRWPEGGSASRTGEPALLILPAGTGNSSHRSIWGDLPWDQVLAAALHGPEPVRLRQIDLIRIVDGDRAVLLGASAGFIAEVTLAAQSLAHIPGRARYMQAMASVFGTHHPYPGRVLVDGELLQEGPTTMVTVGGARHRVGTFQVLPRSILDDGKVDVCVLGGEVAGSERLALAQRVMSGAHLGRPGVHYATGREVVIERTDGEPLCFEHDGEMWPGPASVTLTAVAGAVPMLAPATAVAG